MVEISCRDESPYHGTTESSQKVTIFVQLSLKKEFTTGRKGCGTSKGYYSILTMGLREQGKAG